MPPRRSSTRAQKIAAEEMVDDASSDASPAPPTPVRKRGRPSNAAAAPSPTQGAMATTPKRRGRPPKVRDDEDSEGESPTNKTPRKKTRKSLSEILDEREQRAKTNQSSSSAVSKPRGGPKKSNCVRTKKSMSRSPSPSGSQLSPEKDAVIIDLMSDEDQPEGDAETTKDKTDLSDWEELDVQVDEEDDIFTVKAKAKDIMEVDKKPATRPYMRMSTGGKIPRKKPESESSKILVPSSDASEEDELQSPTKDKKRNSTRKTSGTDKDDQDAYYESEEGDQTPDVNDDSEEDYKDPTPPTPKKITGYKLHKEEDFDTIPDLPPTPSPKKGKTKAPPAHGVKKIKGKFTVTEPQPIVRDDDQQARETDAFESSPHTYVLKSEINTQVPAQCAYKGYRDRIPGSILYAKVTPMPLKEVKALYHPESGSVPMQLSSVWTDMTEGEQKFIIKILTSTGYRHAVNLSRTNPYSKDFQFKVLPGGASDKYKTEMLYVGNTPALCYTLAFATNSSILEPSAVAYGDRMKFIHFNPVVHEYERLTGSLTLISGARQLCVKFYGPGLQASTRGRKDDWRGFTSQASTPKAVRTAPSASGSRFGKLTGATYVSPVKGSGLTRLIKEPSDNIPIYDLRNQNFDLEEDFFNIAHKFDEIHGIEAPILEPLLIAYHVTKWAKESEPDVATVDFNIAWIGVLTKSAIQDPILDIPVMALNG